MRSCRVLTVVVALACVAMFCGSALAQPRAGGPGGPGGMMGGMNSPVMLLMLEQVQKEVELSDEQKAELRSVSEKTQAAMREQFSGLRDMEPEARREAMEKMRGEMEKRTKEVEKQVEGILLPHQTKRLKEIQLQVLGLRALENAEVAKALGITDEQKEKLAAARESARESMQGLFEGFRGLRDLPQEEREAKMAEAREKMEKAQQDVEAKVLAVLSDEQKKTFEEMKGKKFELDMSQMRRPGGGQRPERPATPQ